MVFCTESLAHSLKITGEVVWLAGVPWELMVQVGLARQLQQVVH